jgi:hypothetical protein
MATPQVAYAKRCMFPGEPGEGSKAILMGYGADGKELLGIPCKPRGPVYKWMRGGSPGADRKRVQRALDQMAADDGTS